MSATSKRFAVATVLIVIFFSSACAEGDGFEKNVGATRPTRHDELRRRGELALHDLQLKADAEARAIEERETQASLFRRLFFLQRKEVGCWQRSLREVSQNCESRADEDLQRLAASFTHCFLVETGQKSARAAACAHPDSTVPIKDCLRKLSKDSKAFAAYTQFRVHVFDICFAIEKRNYEEYVTLITTALLQSSARVLSLQEEMSVHVRESLENEREIIELQQDVQTRVGNLSHSVHEIESRAKDFLAELSASSDAIFRQQDLVMEKLGVIQEVVATIKAFLSSAIAQWNAIKRLPLADILLYASFGAAVFAICGTWRTAFAALAATSFQAAFEFLVLRDVLASGSEGESRLLFWGVERILLVTLATGSEGMTREEAASYLLWAERGAAALLFSFLLRRSDGKRGTGSGAEASPMDEKMRVQMHELWLGRLSEEVRKLAALNQNLVEAMHHQQRRASVTRSVPTVKDGSGGRRSTRRKKKN
mmetsp:Transcript_9207/g.18447  ORF Transcript_9207/g.18447 Transcript_9207/m.18447 type:complete len:482 (-) Transcript_9207:75-1520(-)